MAATEVMIDAIRVNAHNIPRSTPKVAGYVTGTGAVPWTATQWDNFPHAGHVRIDQSPPLAAFSAGQADVADVEPFAGTIASFVAAVRARIAAGASERWSTIYGTDATIAAAATQLQGAGPHGWYYGHVDCWLADWNLDEDEAVALIGRQIHGLTCRAVQWASPTSNPGTVVPGGTLTLAQAQVDLSVAAATWHPAPSVPPSPTT
jgi:hypothetical protein